MQKRPRTSVVGEIRPSQLLLTYGVGAIIDLPQLSTLVMGLDDWSTNNAPIIREDRLLQAVQSVLGPQVEYLRHPPISEDSNRNNVFNPIGVPVATFPRWMVCPRCRIMSPVDEGLFKLRTYSGQPRYVHENCAKGHQPTVLPARFMIACEEGHLDDFPWHDFVHKGSKKDCKQVLRMQERGISGEAADIFIRCEVCQDGRSMAEAFSSKEEQSYHPICRGRRPHLRDFEQRKPGQKEHQAKPILLGASNIWFPLVFTTLSLPDAPDLLGDLIGQQWEFLKRARELDDITKQRQFGLLDRFEGYSEAEIWQRVEQKQAGEEKPKVTTPGQLKRPEWQVLGNPHAVLHSHDFDARSVGAPEDYRDQIQQVVLVERLREVRAMTGFTRIESLSDYAEEDDLPASHIMQLSRVNPRWVPAAEVRGEGIFLQFREEAIQAWAQRPDVKALDRVFYGAHRQWRLDRYIPDPEDSYPGIRYVLLHTFAHALIRQLTLESGYTTASIRERIYTQPPTSEGGPMAGVLLYTAASDSEGTLGGLVSLGRPEQLSWHIANAIEEMQTCASDPLCAEHSCKEDHTLHAAACHACLFVPETSCERGNKYLDRSVLTRTFLGKDNLAFFANTGNF